MSLFSTLHTGTSGMSAAQVAVSTTSQNIANADDTSYTRQRVVFAAKMPISSGGVSIGTGVDVKAVVRIHDEFVYAKMRDASTSVQYDSYSKQVLQEAAQYFPDLDSAGISQDINNYFTAWSNLASNSSEGSQKINLVQNAVTLANDLQATRTSLRTLQDSLNTQLKTSIDEINSIGQQVADLNKQISVIESEKGNYANDLRDQRDKLELSLAKLVSVSAWKGNISSDSTVDPNMTDGGTQYYLNISGATLVDGSTFHPLVIDNTSNQSSYYSVYSEMQDGTRYDLSEKLSGGKVGAILDLRGRIVDPNVNGGYPQDGTIQGYIDNLDSFAQTLITDTNNVYAKSAQESLQSPILSLKSDTSFHNAYNNIENGTFDVIVYDTSGNEVARKTITIDTATSMGDDTFSTSILTQINTSKDDNKDNNALNDVDDLFTATFMDNGTFALSPTNKNAGYTIAIEDNGTNFPGVIGVSQFFTGSDSSNIQVATKYRKGPSLMQGYSAPIDGNNKVANAMVQLQYDALNFYNQNGTKVQETIEGYYNALTTTIASDASSASNSYDTNSALYNTIESQYQSISGVNTDEELSNLIIFQSSYSANAKIITTIDEMLNTLLGLKS
jgi:flagellar hook-associated protein 1 FlgK